jgi:hypothetical protein
MSEAVAGVAQKGLSDSIREVLFDWPDKPFRIVLECLAAMGCRSSRDSVSGTLWQMADRGEVDWTPAPSGRLYRLSKRGEINYLVNTMYDEEPDVELRNSLSFLMAPFYVGLDVGAIAALLQWNPAKVQRFRVRALKAGIWRLDGTIAASWDEDYCDIAFLLDGMVLAGRLTRSWTYPYTYKATASFKEEVGVTGGNAFREREEDHSHDGDPRDAQDRLPELRR